MTSTSTQDTRHGKSLEQFLYQTLPYDPFRVVPDCPHPSAYVMQNYAEQPPFCGLCFFKDGFDAEIPTRIHQYKTLADNGNPQQAGKFEAHVYLVMGLSLPPVGMSLYDFRRRRNLLRCTKECDPGCRKHNALAREQYTEAAWRLFPVASALWKLMGYQPPLAIALVRGVQGRTEREIAKELDVSVVNVSIRMVKAIRTAMGYLPKDGKATAERDSSLSGTENYSRAASSA